LLQSRRPRLVVRKTNTTTIVQIVNASVVGDSTVASAISTELSNHGWVAGTGNIPSAYLTGLLAGLRAKSRGVKVAILDVGLNPPVRGSRVYAALKGAVDAGLEIPYSPDVIPDDSRISGQHIVAAYDHFGTKSNMFTKLGKKQRNVRLLKKLQQNPRQKNQRKRNLPSDLHALCQGNQSRRSLSLEARARKARGARVRGDIR
jgi:large subunit ribosomal protein L18